MKDYQPTYIDITQEELRPLLGVSKELVEKGIYARHSVKTQTVNATGNYHITTGFPPRMLEVQVQDSDQFSTGKTDFATTYSIRGYNNGLSGFTTTSSTNLISLSTLTGLATTRHEDGVTINISAYSGTPKTLYITSYS